MIHDDPGSLAVDGPYNVILPFYHLNNPSIISELNFGQNPFLIQSMTS